MSAGLDTSVVLRLLLGEPAAQAASAWKFVVAQSLSAAGPLLVCDMVVAETYFALRHHYEVPHASALAALRGLLDDDRLSATGGARDILAAAQSARSGPGLMDRLIHADYGRDGARMATFDRVASSLSGATLLQG